MVVFIVLCPVVVIKVPPASLRPNQVLAGHSRHKKCRGARYEPMPVLDALDSAHHVRRASALEGGHRGVALVQSRLV